MPQRVVTNFCAGQFIEGLHDWLGVGDVAFRLAHLFLFEEEPTVSKNLFRQRQAGSHQKSWPVDRMKPDDFLADHMNDMRILLHPKLRELCAILRFTIDKAYPAHVTRQRVVPNVKDVLRVAGPWDSPLDGLTADRKILQAAFHKAYYFFEAKIGLDELGLVLVQLRSFPSYAESLKK